MSTQRGDFAASGVIAVTGGTVVTPSGTRQADVLVSAGRVLSVTEPGAVGAAGAGGAAEVIEAAGCLVLPGGVDPHSHILGDVTSATRAAAMGGTTTVLTFTNPETGESATDCLVRRAEELSSTAMAVDVGLHAMLYEPDRVSLAELKALGEQGAAGVKLFLAYSELGIMWSPTGLFELMAMAADLGQVVQVHCEQGELIDSLVTAVLELGATGPRLFASTRPPESEAVSVALVLGTAALTGARCYLVHLSSSDAIEQVRLRRRCGGPEFYAEACLHHLLLDDSHYLEEDAERYLVAPPLRPPQHQLALWDAVADGTLDAVGSDHSQDRSRTIGELAPDGNGYTYGLAGIGARLPLLMSSGLERGIPVERLVELASTGPARAFGLYPRKGAIAPGSDGDLVVFEPGARTTLAADTFDDGTGDSVYTGMSLSGQVRDVLLRGRPIVRDGRYLEAETAGEHVRPSPLPRPG